MSKPRLEAFSDGVMAIAITLLILYVPVPSARGRPLGSWLLAHWPDYAAYVVSFLTIGIIWINHHAMLSRIDEIDHAILTRNLLLLLCVCALPYTTAVLAEFLTSDEGGRVAAALYGGSLLLMAISFYSMQHHMLYRKTHLLREHIRGDTLRSIELKNRAALLPYATATGLAFVSPFITLGIHLRRSGNLLCPTADNRQLSGPARHPFTSRLVRSPERRTHSGRLERPATTGRPSLCSNAPGNR